ncbi:hypothetical protein F506_14665 [Herbaspirillum hiltneri N3]|uniref:DUF1835 domain-containing protein n=1 Tax=Herbaspirillum hiltneri N3 TaxID=1262470 RepID=A0ABM5V2I1_9BURK|nr:DUF3658 domain-containing protein [Herbaspirillum hiltneri]AKZ63742.1 hypothetical protein F506_14665 [Herbaspirillum hiltneri N3]
MTEFHVVSFVGTADAMRIAFPDAHVFCAWDDYSVGPLDDGHGRADFWRRMAQGYSRECMAESTDCFAPWHEMKSVLAGADCSRIFIWHSGSGSEQVFLRMACSWLGELDHALLAVRTPACGGVHSTAAWPPGQLRKFIANAVPVSRLQREEYAREFAAISAQPEMLRECDESGHLHCRPMNVHDDLLLACCSGQWQRAVAVVGEAMGRVDQRNAQGDVFWSSRLQYLVDSGRIEADGERVALGAYRVRLR